MEIDYGFRRDVGKRIYDLRSHLGYRQAKFAEDLDISVTFLSEVENGKKTISLDVLRRMCLLYQVSADYILLGTPMYDDEDTPSRPLIETANQMSNRELDIVIMYLQALKDMRELEKKRRRGY